MDPDLYTCWLKTEAYRRVEYRVKPGRLDPTLDFAERHKFSVQ